MAINIEGSHTSRRSDDDVVLQEKSETVDEIQLPCASGTRDSSVEGCLMIGVAGQWYTSAAGFPVGSLGWLWW